MLGYLNSPGEDAYILFNTLKEIIAYLHENKRYLLNNNLFSVKSELALLSWSFKTLFTHFIKQ